MKKVLIVNGSVRKGRVANKILSYVEDGLKNYPDIEATVFDFEKSPLPFIDSDKLPSDESFVPTDSNVAKWTNLVDEADTVLLLSPEYNHSFSPVLKNAIDWVYKPWNDKPVAFVSYGWAGGTRGVKHLRDVFASNIAAKVLDTEANLYFMKDINPDGSIADENSVKQSIDNVLAKINN